jgi:flagellar biosynthetic protein FlhB
VAEEPDKDSKTEPASEKKIRDSIEKGRLPFSKEAPVFASLLGALGFAMFFAEDSAVRLGAFLTIFLERPDAWPLETTADAITLYRIVYLEIGRAVMAILFLLIVAGLAGSMLQNAPRMVLERIRPQLSRISLRKGWERLFGVQGFVEFLKSVGKLALVIVCLMIAMKGVELQLLSGMVTHPTAFSLVIRDTVITVLVCVVLVMLAISTADLLWSRYHWLQELRMTRHELKEEIKQSEGDPIVKSRLRSLQRDRARQRMMAAVPQATLVIANPTHYAIALRYDRARDAAPLVLAKGVDLVALKIRATAEQHGIPVFEDVALARSMYRQVSVDSMIPRQFYQAVAELVRIVYATRKPSAAKGMA